MAKPREMESSSLFIRLKSCWQVGILRRGSGPARCVSVSVVIEEQLKCTISVPANGPNATVYYSLWMLVVLSGIVACCEGCSDRVVLQRPCEQFKLHRVPILPAAADFLNKFPRLAQVTRMKLSWI